MSTPRGAYDNVKQPTRGRRCACDNPIATIDGATVRCIKCGHEIGTLTTSTPTRPRRRRILTSGPTR